LQELNDLPFACGLSQDWRGEAGLIRFRQCTFPNDVAALFVQSDQSGIASAGRTDDRVTVDQRGFGVSPFTRFAAEIGAKIFLPADFAVADCDAGEIAIRTERIEELAFDSGRGSSCRIWRFLFRISNFAEARLPGALSVFRGVGLHGLVLQ
jgi:hypothetical protein